MKKNNFLAISVFVLLSVFFAAPCSTAQSGTWGKAAVPVLPGGHRGTVNALLYDGQSRVLSAGADGFLGVWNIQDNAASERFQLSSYSISAMVLRPGKNQIALIENDGLGLYRVAAWDYETKKNLFTLRFRDPITYINYSAGGNFLLVARSGRTGMVFVHPETGELLQSPSNLTGPISFAATGRSEKTMISYTSSGRLAYWDLESGNEIRHFTVPPNISSPLLFGSNRFFAGFDREGLLILDAVSGSVLIRDRNISRGTLIQINPDSSDLLCLASSGGSSFLAHMGIDRTGRLETKNRRTVPSSVPYISCVAVASGAAVLGTAEGNVWTFSQDGAARLMAVKNQLRIPEAAAAGSTLALLAEGNTLGFIPLDYTRFRDNSVIRFEDAGPYTHITSDPGGGNEGEEKILLWQSQNTRSFPAIRDLAQGTEDAPGQILSRLPLRFPLRSAAMFQDQALFLDSVGNIVVLNIQTGGIVFSFSSIGSLDASFINDENIIIGRSAVSGGAPFLSVNIVTGETVPLPYPAAIGTKVYRGSGGTIYGAAVDQDAGNSKTAVARLTPSNPPVFTRLIEYPEEDTLFTLTETGGVLASTIGGGGATLYRYGSIIPFERGPGLPFRLIDGGRYFIAVDGEGSVSWHHPQSGKLLALFRLYADEWILEKEGGQMIRGQTAR